jgi:hypothetical protein
VGLNTVAMNYTVPTSGTYWVGIQTTASLYAVQPNGLLLDPGYVAQSGTLAGSRSVWLGSQALNASIQGTPTATQFIVWFALS